MGAALIILQFEDGGEFKERFEAVARTACRIHEEMIRATQSDRMRCGAIQAPDIIQEEFLRAASFSERYGKAAEFLSITTKLAYEWALRQEKLPQSSPDSVSSSPGIKRYFKRTNPKSPLVFATVKTPAGISVKSTKSPPVHKRFEIKTSTLPGAGKGFFLKEDANPGEKIARYSGVLISNKGTSTEIQK